MHDRQSGATTLVSTGHSPAISADGQHVAFSSTSPLVADDTNGYVDAYVHTAAPVWPAWRPVDA